MRWGVRFGQDAIDWRVVCGEGELPWDAAIGRCVAMARSGIVREFPCVLPLVLTEPLAFTRPRDLTPVFYGCFDWHSAVHSHWLLVRVLSVSPASVDASAITAELEQQFNLDALAREVAFLSAPHRAGFERPYGLAWLLQLDAELLTAAIPSAAEWRRRLAPLVQIAAERLTTWFPTLSGPIHSGEHSQTAFAMGLTLDWARAVGREDLADRIAQTALRFHHSIADGGDRSEPSAHDFLSPRLAAADLLRRCLSPRDFADWLTAALPEHAAPQQSWQPVTVTDPSDGKRAHFAGLNFSRAWMAEGIATGLPPGHPSLAAWIELACTHLHAGLPILHSEEYAITHWVGSFAIYALTQRGIM